MGSILFSLILLLIPISINVGQRFSSRKQEYTCFNQRYSTEILSTDPLVIYINNFVNEDEIDHLLSIGKPLFGTSNVLLPGEQQKWQTAQSYRSSSTAFLDYDDPVCDCIGQRALRFLGHVENEAYEPLQLVRYLPGQQYNSHYDWVNGMKGPEDPYDNGRSWNRLSSFFAYLGEDATGGETFFPWIQSAPLHVDGNKFARPEGGSGLAVKPVKGNALFWMNLHPNNGTGDERVLHRGLPIHTGIKYGMNLWTKHYEGSAIVDDS